MSSSTITLAELANLLEAKIEGDASCEIMGIASLVSAGPGHISFLDNPKYQQHLETTKASAVIVSPGFSEFCPCNALVVDNPYYAYALAAQCFLPKRQLTSGIHASAVIGDDCQIHETVSIGANAVIGNNTVILENSVIEAGCVINECCLIGANTHLYPNVTIYHHCEVGSHVIIHAGAVIGSDGFGFAKYQRKWHKVPQLGRVIIADEVEIGASTTIDRGALEDTYIGFDVKLDNQIQIAHNVQLGDHTAIAGCTAIAGSTKVGKDCLIAGCVGVGGHLELCDNVAVTGHTSITKSIKNSGVYSSTLPAQPDKKWKRNVARFHGLDKMHHKVKTIEQFIQQLTTPEEE